MSTKKIQIIDGRILQSGEMRQATLRADGWDGTDIYTQTIYVDNVTANSKIDIQASAQVMKTIIDNGYCLSVENDNGVVTAYAIGNKPSVDLDIQMVIAAVKRSSQEPIWGNTLR